jgi:heterodisulfide reductase subunit C
MPSTTTPRSMEELNNIFLEDVYKIPEGENIRQCIQCGTCSGSCPTSYAMDYTPREIIAAFRAGMLDRVLKSNTVWMCASCYYCTVRCPAGIKLTDIMYELKRLGIEYGLYAKGVTAPVLSKTFVKMVDKYGRSPEMELLSRFTLATNPFKVFGMAPLGVKMFFKGRLGIFPKSIKGKADLAKILKSALKEQENEIQAKPEEKKEGH